MAILKKIATVFIAESIMFKSLRTKFIILVILTILVFVVIGSGLMLMDKRKYLRDHLFENSKLFALYTAGKFYEYHGGYYWQRGAETDKTFTTLIDSLLEKNKDVRQVLLLSANGKILFDTTELKEGWYEGAEERKIIDEVTLNNIDKLKESVAQGISDPMFGQTQQRKGEEVIEILSPVIFGDITAGVVVYYLSLGSIRQALMQTTIAVVMVSLGFIAMGVVLAIFLANIIIRPVTKTSLIMRDIASSSNLTKTLDIKGDREITQLAQAFNELTKGLREVISKIHTNTEKVSIASKQFFNVSSETNESLIVVTNTIQEISRGAGTQLELVKEVEAAFQELTANLREVARSADSASKSSIESVSQANKGQASATELVDTMTMIVEASNRAFSAIQKLKTSSNEIGNIVTTITSFADQTNLLSLNAAIEAARAGEAGRGFAVVAEEVRKLADGSVNAANKIAQLIQNIINDIGDAVSFVLKEKETAEKGITIVNNTGQVQKEILKAANQVEELMSKISSSVGRQLILTEKTLPNFTRVANVADHNAAATEEFSANVEEITSSMQELSAGASELSKNALDLKDSVSKFIVKK